MLDSLRLTALAVATVTTAVTAAAQTPEIPEDKDPQTTASGLQYSILAKGDGTTRPKVNDTVKVHYTGFLTDGTVFDSSRQRGTPAEFPLNGVIAGWTEGLQLMSPGARFKFTIPSELGYGSQGAGGTIPPNATLVFDVELLEITKVGPALPIFAPLDPAQTKTTESGTEYQIVNPGNGAQLTGSDPMCLEWALFSPDGKLVDCSSLSAGPIFATIDTVQVPFFKDLPALMKEGAEVRLKVSAANSMRHPKLDPESDAIWHLKLKNIFTVPTFTMPAEDTLTKTDSGLAYVVDREGEGKAPLVTEQVRCHYTGWLTDGTMFDSSYERSQPATFPLRGVIKGWTEGLQLMKPGSKYTFVIPGDLAYGPRGSGSKIPPDATLVFTIELIEVLAGR